MLVEGLTQVEDAEEEVGRGAVEGEDKALVPLGLVGLVAHAGAAVGGVQDEAAVGVELPQTASVG
eukprot:762900-Hanusia_phi.AAC.3